MTNKDKGKQSWLTVLWFLHWFNHGKSQEERLKEFSSFFHCGILHFHDLQTAKYTELTGVEPHTLSQMRMVGCCTKTSMNIEMYTITLSQNGMKWVYIHPFLDEDGSGSQQPVIILSQVWIYRVITSYS